MQQKRFLRLLISTLIVFSFVLAACQPEATSIAELEEVADVNATEAVTEEAEATQASEATEDVANDVTGPIEGGTLIYGFLTKPSSLDPSVWTGRSDNEIMRQIYDSLVYSPEAGVYEPWLAESWTVSDDGLVYTFTLRKDVTFHDGTPLKAESFKFTYDRMMNPETQSLRVGDMGDVQEVNVLDEYTFEVVLGEPFAAFMANASVMPLVPVSQAAVEEFGTDFAQHPVGTGPFMFEKWEGNDLYLVRNPDYNWAPASMDQQGPAYLERIIVKEVPEASTRMVALQTGEINYTHFPVFEELANMESLGFKVYQLETPGWVKSLPINMEFAPTDDIRVRQAILYGVDRQQIVDIICQGYGVVSYSILTHKTLGYDPALESYYNYDPQKASDLLDEAGWIDSNGDGIREKDGQNLTLKMIMFDSGTNKATAELVQAMLMEMGFEASLEAMAYDAFAEAVARGEYNTAEMNWVALDPSVVIYNMLHSDQIEEGGQFNRSHMRSEEMDELIDLGSTTTDPEARADIYSQIQIMAMEQAVALPMYDSAVVNVTTGNMQGISYNLMGAPEFFKVWFSE